MIRRTLLWAALSVALPAVAAAPADAPPSEAASALIEGLPPSQPPPSDEAAKALAHTIGSELRCPVCQGLSVVDSNSNAAVSMQRRIEGLVRAGYTQTEIEDYFISKYGEWVLLKPRSNGLNQLVWIGPFLALGLGVMAALSFLRTQDNDEGPGTVVNEGGPRDFAQPTDPYLARLLKDVDDDA